MPFRKKALYYGIMLLLTLLALEGMARLAYYAAYGQGYSRDRSAMPLNSAPSPGPYIPAQTRPEDLDPLETPELRHPFYGYTDGWPSYTQSAMTSRQGQDAPAVIALLGGSVAKGVNPFLQAALNRRFAANSPSRQPLIVDLAIYSGKQPQQALMVASALLRGGEFDLIINLDGFNELDSSLQGNFDRGVFPFFPNRWNNRVGLTSGELLLVGRIGILRREQARLTAAGETSPLRWSRLFRLTNRYRQERTAAQIIRLNHALADAKAAYSLEKYGPRNWRLERGDTLQAAARVWYRGSAALAQLAELAGADYYHFLQPNQYVPGAKPLSAEELEFAYRPDSSEKSIVEQGYPLLQGFNPALQSRGINYFDLTGIFADHPETLYYDDCCHLNDRGRKLLAAAMVARLEPALRRLDGAGPGRSVSALAAARPPRQPAARRAAREFQVSLSEDRKRLRYVQENCVPEDLEPRFFLHLMPRVFDGRPPPGQENGFANRDFDFGVAGGRFEQGQCAVLIELPDYPIAEIQTGQANLWQVSLYPPADPGPLQAAYAALAQVQPAAQDYFDLYVADNRLIYLRETCAAADTAADFFLHIIPEDITGLPAERQAAGFVHSGFAFAHRGGHFAGKCLAAVSLPDYPVKEIRTGQHTSGQGDLWSVNLIAAPAPAQLRAKHAALFAAAPVDRDVFDLYVLDRRLIYLRETCAVADTAADFFLHIVPENPADLPEERRAAGFAHGGFAFARQGGYFDGKCLASVPLPDYPIAAMRTGQYVPGQGELWSVELRAAP